MSFGEVTAFWYSRSEDAEFCAIGSDVVHVRGVLVVPALPLARVDPEHETEDDRDRERHEAGEPREGDRPVRRLRRALRAAPRDGLIRRRGLPGASCVAGSSKNSRSFSSS